jgi:hypothetical protein
MPVKPDSQACTTRRRVPRNRASATAQRSASPAPADPSTPTTTTASRSAVPLTLTPSRPGPDRSGARNTRALPLRTRPHAPPPRLAAVARERAVQPPADPCRRAAPVRASLTLERGTGSGSAPNRTLRANRAQQPPGSPTEISESQVALPPSGGRTPRNALRNPTPSTTTTHPAPNPAALYPACHVSPKVRAVASRDSVDVDELYQCDPSAPSSTEHWPRHRALAHEHTSVAPRLAIDWAASRILASGATRGHPCRTSLASGFLLNPIGSNPLRSPAPITTTTTYARPTPRR